MKPPPEDTRPGRAWGRCDFVAGRKPGRAGAQGQVRLPEWAGAAQSDGFAPAGPTANRLIPFPPLPPLLEVGLIAALAGVVCAGILSLRRLQPETDQIALYGQDGQGDGSPDVD